MLRNDALHVIHPFDRLLPGLSLPLRTKKRACVCNEHIVDAVRPIKIDLAEKGVQDASIIGENPNDAACKGASHLSAMPCPAGPIERLFVCKLDPPALLAPLDCHKVLAIVRLGRVSEIAKDGGGHVSAGTLRVPTVYHQLPHHAGGVERPIAGYDRVSNGLFRARECVRDKACFTSPRRSIRRR